jgi:hypothetical protein
LAVKGSCWLHTLAANTTAKTTTVVAVAGCLTQRSTLQQLQQSQQEQQQQQAAVGAAAVGAVGARRRRFHQR